VEADLRSGIRRAAMLTVSTATKQLFHTKPRIGLAELRLKSNLDLQ
jgi:hypothetical protein